MTRTSKVGLDRRGFVKRLAAVGVSAASAASLTKALRAQRGRRPRAPSPSRRLGRVERAQPHGDRADPRHRAARQSRARLSLPPTQHDLGSDGYTEQEFFFSGSASRYTVSTGQLTTATVVDTGHPYKTRMVVRRPVKAKNFNGTVLVEWYNVTVGFDVEANWFRYHDEIVREGYAWVGIRRSGSGSTTSRRGAPLATGAWT